ncbi:hypothetical protein KVV02_002646 [Mortierella alpina]|uniref:BHLH domain-containing protein n=1 Tax=Mortierella alpina TaxID=64518 RepID=A0A9P8A9P0_MORAP|nr:hypothetical protein KVV02_002646 [Mortierella alpina]
MASQSIMVPPNNAPWPGLQAPTQPQTTSSQPSSVSSSHAAYSPAHAAPPHSSSYPAAPYYHHPAHHHHAHPPPPPPPHSPHQQPYYPYHPYAGAPYPSPYPPAHGSSHPPPHPAHPSHPGYHHPHSHYPSSSHLHPPAAQDTVSASHAPGSPSSLHETSSGTVSAIKQSLHDSAAKGSIKTKPAPATKIGKTGAETSGKGTSKAGSSSSTTPKTFRFEGSISSETYKTTKSFDLAGVNILNRKPLDTRTALDKLQRRRETHNRVERKRRDCINQLVDDLTKLLPAKHLEEASSKCHRVNVLRGAVAHIKFLTETNTVLTKSLDAARDEGFKVPPTTDLLATSSNGIDDSAPSIEAAAEAVAAKDQDMSMDVDVSQQPIKQEEKDELEDDDDEDEDDEELARAEKTSSRSTSPSISSKTSTSASSPRLTPSKALMTNKQQWPPVIITNAPSPSSDRESPRQSQAQAKDALVPPPISIITAPADPSGAESASQHKRTKSLGTMATSPTSSSFASSPMFPPSSYPSSAPSSSAFPPSPVSPSPSARQNPFSLQVSQAEEGQGHARDQQQQQQLSPFMQHRPSVTSPSLPPISSLATMQLQSPSGGLMDTASGRQTSPSLRPMAHQRTPSDSSPSSAAEAIGKYTGHQQHPQQHHHHSQRTGPTLPPLKIPGAQHLHPSHAANGISNGSGNSKTLSPHRSAESEQQPPVSPFMLSPMMSRSPSMGPLSSSSAGGTSPYPQWGPEGTDAGAPPPPPPPHHPGHYMPGAHGYPPATARPPQPEPIFIQEEPWIVQRKRSTSNNNGHSGKNSSSAKQTAASKKAGGGGQTTEKVAEDANASSSSSYPGRSNHRKRSSSSSQKGGSMEDGLEEEGTSKRAKSMTEEEAALSDVTKKEQADHPPQQQQQDNNSSGIVVVVVGADDGDVTEKKGLRSRVQRGFSN